MTHLNLIATKPPPPDTVGLRYFSPKLPGAAAHTGLLKHSDQSGNIPEQYADGCLVADPLQNKFLIG
jgi:hypothetical protein